MATYYRWRQSEISVTHGTNQTNSITPSNSKVPFLNIYLVPKLTYYNTYQLFFDEQYLFQSIEVSSTTGESVNVTLSNNTGNEQYMALIPSENEGGDAIFNWVFIIPAYTTVYMIVQRSTSIEGAISIIFYQSSDYTQALFLTYYNKFNIGPGGTSTYVYSLSSNLYPTNGISGDYWYSRRTTITSPTAPTNLTYPNPIINKTVTVSWNAATSNVPGVTITDYKTYYNYAGEWWGFGTQSNNTSEECTIPSSPTLPSSISFRVSAIDSNEQASNYIIGNTVPIYYPPTLTAPSLAMQDQPITITWNSVQTATSYNLQRKSNIDSNWVTVYSGSDLTFTETVGAWTNIQYQIQAVFPSGTGDFGSGSFGNYVTVSVINPNILVISGQDSNLGTITSNIPYTVSSNTGNPISLTRTVNGAQVTTLTVNSGFAYSIPIADLPTGTGTIVITAQVQDTGGETVTQTRTWTYYKTPIDIPSTGGIAQLTQNGQNIWPTTIADAVQAPVYLGGNLNAALNKLGQAALYTKIGTPLYNEVTVNLANVSVGDEVNLPENGVMVPFIVGSLNYEPTLNTSGDRVLLIRKDVYQQGQWNSTNVNTYASSTIDTWFNSTYKNLLDTTVQNQLDETSFYYTPGNGDWTVTTLSRPVFTLSGTEGGFVNVYLNEEGNNLNITSLLLGNEYLSRSPVINDTTIWNIHQNKIYDTGVTYQRYYRPCFTLPITFNQTYYVDTGNVVYPAQDYTQGGSITDVFGYDVPIAQSESGTYVGTGTTGASNPNSISLSFIPKFVCITNKTDSSKRAFLPYGGYGVCWIQNTATNTAISAYGIATTWTTNGVSWYNSNVVQQMNESGDTYQYTAFA